jgi:subtilase family serine protease
VDRIGLRCQAGTVAAITPANQNQPDLRVAIRGYPTVVTSNTRITYRVELWNVGGAAANAATVNIVTPGAADAEFSQHPSFNIAVTCNSDAGTGRRCTAGAAIPSRSRMVVAVEMTPQGGGVEVESSAIADEPTQIAESNETNNTASVRLRRVINP